MGGLIPVPSVSHCPGQPCSALTSHSEGALLSWGARKREDSTPTPPARPCDGLRDAGGDRGHAIALSLCDHTDDAAACPCPRRSVAARAPQPAGRALGLGRRQAPVFGLENFESTTNQPAASRRPGCTEGLTLSVPNGSASSGLHTAKTPVLFHLRELGSKAGSACFLSLPLLIFKNVCVCLKT